MTYLQAVTPGELVEAVPGISLSEARKIVGAVHRRDSLPASIAMVRRTSLEAVRFGGSLPQLAVRSVLPSGVDPFVKYALETADGRVVEAVRIPLERRGRFTVCVSSQAGCALACTFCATGRMGPGRNLAAWEIVEQVRVVKRGLDRAARQRVHGVVFQGMGEPLANADNVIRAIRVLAEPAALAIDGRTITVCTAGIPDGIRRLARELPKVRLAVSVGSARPEVRRDLMPLDRAYPLPEVLDAAVAHTRATGLAPMWAVTLLAGVNDTEEDAHALLRHARQFYDQTRLRPQIRLIPFNSIDAPGPPSYQRTDETREKVFCGILRGGGFPMHKRYSGGADVHAACGQLSGLLRQ